jgi:hypothetical protein
MRAAWSFAALGSVVAAPAAADQLQNQLLAEMRATHTDNLAFAMTIRAEQTGNAAQISVLRHDGRGGWSLESVNGRPPTDKQRKKVAKSHPPLPSYARLANWFGGPATRVAATPGSVTYRFSRLPAGTVKLGSHDASAETVADAVVDTSGAHPFVSRVRFTSTAPFRMMLVAKVERFTILSSYQRLGDGRVFTAGSDTEFAGSMMGKAGSLTTRVRVSDVHPAR